MKGVGVHGWMEENMYDGSGAVHCWITREEEMQDGGGVYEWRHGLLEYLWGTEGTLLGWGLQPPKQRKLAQDELVLSKRVVRKFLGRVFTATTTTILSSIVSACIVRFCSERLFLVSDIGS